MIAAIVAVNKDWGIGYQNQLLEHIPDDLKRFKELTTGNMVVMGSNTWRSLPVKPLPNRYNAVITRNPLAFMGTEEDTIFSTWENIVNFLETYNERYMGDVFIIGGERVYRELLPYCDKVYLTRINKSHENVDTYFPNLNKMESWTCYEPTDWMEHEGTEYRYELYCRH